MNRVIWVFDDVESLKKGYTERLRSLPIIGKQGYDVVSLRAEEFQRGMGLLKERQQRTRKGKAWPDDFLKLDDVAIFIIDYDLLKSEGFLTGETVAYLTRCFSRCGLILGLNQYGKNSYDLTLRGHPESYADLNVGSDQFDNPGLWGGKFLQEAKARKKDRIFRPWHWPNLPAYFELLQKRIDDVSKHSDQPICSVLGMGQIAALLPKKVGQFITGRTRSSPAKVTFTGFVTESGNGLKGRYKSATPEMIARIGAARVSKWLERLVLPSQEILIDAPHLVLRYPSLLKGNPSDVRTWNQTSNFESYRKLPLDHGRIAKFRFKKEYWLSRPAWFWEGISNLQTIKEVSEPWKRESTSLVFCEDSSVFRDRKHCKEFIADVDSPYVRRFVLRSDRRVQYAPENRFLAG
jgi:hypothetical protein